MGTAWAWEPSAAVWRVGLSKANLFFMPRPVSNKSSTTVLRVSWAVKLLLKHDPCHVGDLQDNWLTSDVKRSGWGACPVLYVKDETQAALIPLRPCYWPPSWEQKTLVLRRPWIWIYIVFCHAESNRATLIWAKPCRQWTCPGVGQAGPGPPPRRLQVTSRNCSQPVTSTRLPLKSILNSYLCRKPERKMFL